MKIAIDVSPLESGHKVRGVGYYVKNLLDSLNTYVPQHIYHAFKSGEKLPTDIDLVHYPYFEPFFLTLPFRFSYPTVITIHDLIPLKFPDLFPAGKKGLLKWQIQKRLTKQAKMIITDSDASRQDIQSLLHIQQDRIKVVHLAANHEFRKIPVSDAQRKELRRQYNVPERFVLYVGDATANKNLPILLEAVTRAGIPLVMVGKTLATSDFDASNVWNKDLVRIQQSARENTNIHILGFVPSGDLVKLYTIASVYIQPSFYEGFGLPLLEAMSCGTPVVTTKESSLPEVGGDAPVYVKHNNPESFAEAIESLMKNKPLHEKHAKLGLIQAEKFSWKKTALETVKVYEGILKI